MMVIKRVTHAGEHPGDLVGAREDVLIWDYGVTTGHVAAVHVLQDGAADLVVEFEVPQHEEDVPDDRCARVQACRLDRRCPFYVGCDAHEHEPDCGGCS